MRRRSDATARLNSHLFSGTIAHRTHAKPRRIENRRNRLSAATAATAADRTTIGARRVVASSICAAHITSMDLGCAQACASLNSHYARNACRDAMRWPRAAAAAFVRRTAPKLINIHFPYGRRFAVQPVGGDRWLGRVGGSRPHISKCNVYDRIASHWPTRAQCASNLFA